MCVRWNVKLIYYRDWVRREWCDNFWKSGTNSLYQSQLESVGMCRVGGELYAPPFQPPFVRSLKNLYSFDPYILAKMRKMSYFDPYILAKMRKMSYLDPSFSSKLGKIYRHCHSKIYQLVCRAAHFVTQNWPTEAKPRGIIVCSTILW